MGTDGGGDDPIRSRAGWRRRKREGAVPRPGDDAGGAVSRRRGGVFEDGASVRGDLVGIGGRLGDAARQRPADGNADVLFRSEAPGDDEAGVDGGGAGPVSRSRNAGGGVREGAAGADGGGGRTGRREHIPGRGALHLLARGGSVGHGRPSVPGPVQHADAAGGAAIPKPGGAVLDGDGFDHAGRVAAAGGVGEQQRSAELLFADGGRHGRRPGADALCGPRAGGAADQEATDPVQASVGWAGALDHGVFAAGLPAGVKYPAIVWAYPAEFGAASAASEVSGSTDRFT